MSGDQWFYRFGGRPHGPFTPTQFEKLIRGRAVTPDTEVSDDGHTWATLREVLTVGLARPVPAEPPAEWMEAPTEAGR